jgi:hypothetical protein
MDRTELIAKEIDESVEKEDKSSEESKEWYRVL